MLLLKQAYAIAKQHHPEALIGLRISSGYNFFYEDAIRVEAMTGIRLNRTKPPGIHINDHHLPLLWAWGYTIVSLDREEAGNG